MAERGKKRNRVRHRGLIQLLFAAASNSYATGFIVGRLYRGNLKVLCAPGLNCYSCPGAVMACPIGSLQAVLGSSAFTVSAYVLGIITLFGAVLGRMVCGFLCPFGLIQELIHKIPFPVKKNRFRGDRPLRRMKWVVLLVFVLLLPSVMNDLSGNAPPAFCKYVCPAGALEAGIPHVLYSRAEKAPAGNSPFAIRGNFSAGQPRGLKVGTLFYLKISVLALIVFSSLVVYRPFCKYVCPLGAAYGLFNRVSLYRLRYSPSLCVRCGKCAKACKMCLDPTNPKDLNHAECVRCGDCVNACPVDALKMGFLAGAPVPSRGKEEV